MGWIVRAGVALGVAAGIAVVAVSFGCSSADATAGLDKGQELAAENCSRCHAEAVRDALVARHVAASEDGAASLDPFLARHHVPEAGPRADLVAYLKSRLAPN